MSNNMLIGKRKIRKITPVCKNRNTIPKKFELPCPLSNHYRAMMVYLIIGRIKL
jgi:hypothetical protein